MLMKQPFRDRWKGGRKFKMKKEKDSAGEEIKFCPICGHEGYDVICPICGKKMESVDFEMDRILEKEEGNKDLLNVSLEDEQVKEEKQEKEGEKSENI